MRRHLPLALPGLAFVALTLGVPGRLCARTAPLEGPPDDPAQLDYEAARGCPDRRGFVAELRRRLPQGIQVAAGTVLTIIISTDGAETHGSLRFDGGMREVSGRSCGDVVRALALVAALALESAAEPPSASADANVDEAEDADADAAEPAPARGQPTPSVLLPPPPPPAGFLGGWHVGAGVGLAYGIGFAPEAVLAVPLFLDVIGKDTGWLSPALRVGFVRRSSGSIMTQVGAAELTWTVGSLDGCAVQLPMGRRLPLTVRGCGRVEAGAIEASAGPMVAHPTHPVRPWLAVGPTARLSWAAWKRLSCEGEVAAVFPLIRDRFFVEPATTIREVPAAAVTATFGLAVRFF
jgi:hypothetical protein